MDFTIKSKKEAKKLSKKDNPSNPDAIKPKQPKSKLQKTKKIEIKKAKPKKKKKSALDKKHLLESFLMKAGYSIKVDVLKKRVFYFTLILTSILSASTLLLGVINNKKPLDIFLFNLGLWTALFAFIYIFSWGFLYFFLDMRMFSRTKQVEEVLPDFLQLTSANISAGMPIDKALWFAIRPNFGILAKDIEEVAKATVAGEELKESLTRLSNKYESIDLKRSINLLLEGMDSGGEMADLLNKISNNIQESRILKQEMSANVATYAIFITFASIGAAPVLFALATELLKIVINIAGSLDLGGASGIGFSLNISSSTKMISDFKVFCMMMLSVSAFFSASIVAVIRKGKIKESVRSIPIFIIISIVIYLVSSYFLGTLLSGFF